jgi:hypothetical protein
MTALMCFGQHDQKNIARLRADFMPTLTRKSWVSFFVPI